MSDRYQEQPMSLARKFAIAGAILLGAAVLAFIIQNSESVTVEFLSFTMEAPLFLVMILSGFAALGLQKLIGWSLRRRARAVERREHDRDDD
jgi:uncharacterized integral membrane protein